MRQARCWMCKKMAMVNKCTERGADIGEYCADCFDSVAHDEPMRNKNYSSAGPNHNDPGFDNVIRALEEDR